MGMPARAANWRTMACRRGASASLTGWALFIRSTAPALPHQAKRFIPAAISSAMTAPPLPPMA